MNKLNISVSLIAMKNRIDSLSFRHVMGSFATGIAVVSMRDDEFGDVGFTINSLTSVSLDPPLILFCIDKSAHMYKTLRRADRFAINFLAKNQDDFSNHFAYRSDPPMKNLWEPKRRKNCPVVRGSLGWVLCEPRSFYKGGDHTIFLCEVTDLQLNKISDDPLIYFRGRYRALGKVTSGARK